jgi:hypothetical protein
MFMNLSKGVAMVCGSEIFRSRAELRSPLDISSPARNPRRGRVDRGDAWELAIVQERRRDARDSEMNVRNIDGLMRAMELEGNARIDIIRIGKDIQTAGYARRSPSVQQYEDLRRAVVQWQRIADDIGRIIGSG